MTAKFLTRFASFALLALLALPAMAQQTGTINGTVATDSGDPLPGVVLTIQSSSLQGSRSTVSQGSGQFLFRLLPPGDYSVTATMPGMQTIKKDVRVPVGVTVRPRISMNPESTSEVLVVTADSVFELDTTTVGSNFEGDFIEKLPRGRTLNAVATLAPGVATGAFGGISIAGSPATENIYMVNGTVVNGDNIRGRPRNLFIQDDIQETQVLTGNVSAEFGNFVGGVVNTVTKSGGNEYHGTLRVELDRQDWRARTPPEAASGTELDDNLDQIYTFTFNGPIVKDRLWFAVAGRNNEDDSSRTFRQGTALPDTVADALNVPRQSPQPLRQYQTASEAQRLQLKLTGTIAENHTVVASYLDEDFDRTNRATFTTLDFSGLDGVYSQPEELFALNYRGIITPAFTISANWASRKLQLDGGGQFDGANSIADRIPGTSLLHRDQGNAYSNSSFGRGGDPEDRDSQNWSVKLSYFFDSSNTGSHDFVFGVEELTEERRANNHQSASGWQFRPRWTRFDDNGSPIPIFNNAPGTGGAWIIYWPIVNPSQGSDFQTRSAFVNDVWTLNEKWFFNLGLRYDQNDTSAEDGQELSSDDKISPRLSANFDVFGDGRHQFVLGYNQYTAKLNDSANDVSIAGSPALFAFFYRGPQTESMTDVFNWIEANFPGGIAAVENIDINQINANPNLWFFNYSPDTSFESLGTVIGGGNLESMGVDEITFGYKYRLGSRGFIRSDITFREFNNFYIDTINSTTGQTNVGADRTVIVNDDDNYERDYVGLTLFGNYAISDKFRLGGNYTYSNLEGNINGETSGAGAINTGRTTTYPEFHTFDRANTVSRLPEDTPHNLRLWAVYDLATSFGDFTFSGLQTYISGTPFGKSVALNIAGREAAFGLPTPATDTPFYATPPQTVNYDITDSDAFDWDDFVSTDLSIYYGLNIAKRFDFFVEFEITNIFNNDAVTGGNTTVNNTKPDGSPGDAFNVFTETPVEGVHYTTGNNFGLPTGSGSYQNSRRFQLDLGIKF